MAIRLLTVYPAAIPVKDKFIPVVVLKYDDGKDEVQVGAHPEVEYDSWEEAFAYAEAEANSVIFNKGNWNFCA